MINTYKFVNCDYPDCMEEEGPGHDAEEARACAQAQGWVRRAGKDYCQVHADDYRHSTK